MEIKHTTRIWLIPLALGWLCDLLILNQRPGINFPIFSAITLAAGLFLVTGEGKKPRTSSLLLIIPILFFAVMFAVRAEQFTQAVNFLFTMGGLVLFTATLLGGRWIHYSVLDLVINPILVAWGAVIEPLRFFTRKKSGEADSADTEAAPAKSSPLLPLLRGLLLAVPIVALLAGLLASADPVFSDALERFLGIFRIENLAEYIFRAVFIVVLAFLLMGVYLYATLRSQNEKLTGRDKPLVPAFLGWIEAGVVLSLVNLLFALFVGVQVRYFFGGTANINLDGFTYAEYARRGFGELVAVAVVSLLLLQVLSAVVKRLEKRQATIFSTLGAALVLLVLVILVSAFQRLWLYESAYGFTQTRTYTHIFIIWLGLLLVTTFILEITRNTRAFAVATLFAALGFAISINVINIDAFVVRQNVTRAQMGYELDAPYFLTLSTDATPPLSAAFQDASLPADVRDQLGAVLVCKSLPSELERFNRADWRSWNFSINRAAQILTGVQPALSGYRTVELDYGYRVLTPLNGSLDCNTLRWID